jgi:hypothetical protein
MRSESRRPITARALKNDADQLDELVGEPADLAVDGLVVRSDRLEAGDPGGIRRADKKRKAINYHAGVEVGRGCSRVVVEGNWIHSPRGTANSWKDGHPAGPQGIILAETGGNNVVRYNDIIGSESHWWNDAIESIRNRSITGGPYRDTDVYGNVLAFANDDGIELDGGQINVRSWHNWITGALCGVSCAPNRKGPSYVFRNLTARGGLALPPGHEQHAVKAQPRFAGAARGDYRLDRGSPGIDQGCRLPGLNDGFTGTAPDMGAFELGGSASGAFPPRPSGMTALPQRLALIRTNAPAPKGTIRLTVPSKAGRHWRALPNSPWLRCEPNTGPASDVAQDVTVTAAGQGLDVRQHRGTVTFRTDKGFGRTVMADLKVYPPRPFSLAFEAEEGNVQGGLVKVEDTSASGGAYLHPPRSDAPGSVELSVEVPGDGTIFVIARCLVPDPNSGMHDSFFFSMDGCAKRIWDLQDVGARHWGWCLLTARDEGSLTSPQRFRLKRGRRRLTIFSREFLARLDRVIVTNSPYAGGAVIRKRKEGGRKRQAQRWLAVHVEEAATASTTGKDDRRAVSERLGTVNVTRIILLPISDCTLWRQQPYRPKESDAVM